MTRPSKESERSRPVSDPQSPDRPDAVREIREPDPGLEPPRRKIDSSLLHSALAEISHEIRNSLTGIIKLADLLSEKAISTQGKEYAGRIRKSGKQLERTVETVLSLAKLETAPSTLDCGPVDVSGEVEAIFQTFKSRAVAKGLDCTLTLGEADGPLRASLHSGALSSIVQNLLSNAIKYTDTGSVRVFVRSVRVSGTPMVEIEVADTGVGICESFSSALLRRFTQESTAVEDFSGGTGFGLALVKRFAEQMGGTVDFETENGNGNRFFVRFPRITEQATPAQETPPGPACLPDPRAEILFIEGNPGTQRAIRLLLEGRWALTSTPSSEEGLRLVSERRDGCRRPFDLILLGTERERCSSDQNFLHHLENRTNGQHIPVVALAHGDQPQPAHLALDGYIREPFTSSKLVIEIARYLDGDV